MKRREFLKSCAAAAATATSQSTLFAQHSHGDVADTRIYESPIKAMRAPPERLAYVVAVRTGTDVKAPDYLATVDLDPKSSSFSQVIHRLPMPNVGDELHHFGWNQCGSCHGFGKRRYLVIPGLASSRIHIVDTQDLRNPKLHRVIEPEHVKAKTKLSTPHTVHCLADGRIMISMLGDADGNAPGGFMMLDREFNIIENWPASADGMRFNYDFWYQPRHNVMVSSEWAAPNTVRQGFNPEHVQAGKYGRHVHFWDWKERRIGKSIDLGDEGLIPLEVRFHHNPDSTHGFVGAALSSVMWHWEKRDAQWHTEKVISVDPVEVDGWPFPVPGLITDLVVSMDDRWLYFSNWLHGDIRQYDVSDPANPRLAGQLWLGGVLGKAVRIRGHELQGGPQMLQLSLDGRRLYVTNSLYSVWDNQFYPEIGQQGSWMLSIECDTDAGGLSLNEDFFVDFGQEPFGPARAHELRFPFGDCTSDIWI